MNRAITITASLGFVAAGFGIGALGIVWSPWPIPRSVWAATAVGLSVGVLEVLAVRRFGHRKLQELLLLDGQPFPFASLGLAVAMLVLGSP